MPFDLAEIDAIPAFVKGLRDEFGAIYGLVNNAGIGTEGLLATMHNSLRSRRWCVSTFCRR